MVTNISIGDEVHVKTCQYLDGSVQVGFLPAVVQQTCDSDAIRQVVDKGDVVDQVVGFSNAEYNNGGSALKNTARHDNVMNIKGTRHQFYTNH